MKKYLILFLAVINFIFGSAQCDSSYILCTQEEVDSFQIRYGPCTEVYSITLEDDCDYLHIDGLKGITHIENLKIVGNSNNKLISLQGLDSLATVGDFRYSMSEEIKNAFPRLDSISRLSHVFLGSSRDLALYSNVRAINNLSTSGDGEFSGLENFIPKDSFRLSIANNTWPSPVGTFLQGTPPILSEFILFQSSHILLSGLENYDSIGKLQIFNCSDLDLSPMMGIDQLNYLDIVGASKGVNFANGFTKIEDILVLELRSSPFINLEEIVPSLKRIKCALNLHNNTSLNDVGLLSNIPAQTLRQPKQLPLRLRDRYLRISGSPSLASCTNRYICDMIERYPDSVFFSRNGQFCNQEHLTEVGCKTLNAKDKILNTNIKIMPNPTVSSLILDRQISFFIIYSIHGAEILSGSDATHEIDVSILPVGTYLLKMMSESGHWSSNIFNKN